MSSRIERFVIALVFALVAAGVTLVVASTQDGAPPPQGTGFSTDCTVCHAGQADTFDGGAGAWLAHRWVVARLRHVEA